MAHKPNLNYRMIIMFLAFCVLLATGCLKPARCDENVALKSLEIGVSSSPTPWTADNIRKRPYLIYDGKPTTMTVLWQTYQTPANATIEWGTTTSYGEGSFTVQENGGSSDKHQFSHTISNLHPATRYYYRVTNDTFSHTGSFMTGPPSDSTTLSFYGYGDTRPQFVNPPVEHNAVLSTLLSDLNQNPDQRQTLLVHLGDYVYNGLNEFLWDMQQFNLNPLYDAMSTTFSSLPFMGVLGNHEGFDAYTVQSVVTNYQNIGELFRKYYPYRYPDKNHFYYSFDYGPVHFAIIDTWSYQGASSEQQTIDDAQANWLTRDLRASRKPWKIAMLHTPIWQCTRGVPAMQAQLTPLLKDGGVHLVLQGHQHYYSHAETEGPYEGMTFLTLGGGGARLNPEATCVREDNKKWPPFAVSAFHFARFDISGNAMTVTVIDVDGTVVESFQITNQAAVSQ
jgi:hypothetical protein